MLDPRFLQLDLPRTQEIRRLEARHQPQRPQQVPTLSTLPHGDVRLDHAFATARSLDLHVTQDPPGRQVASTFRPYDFPGETHSTGPSPHAPPSVCSQGQLGPVVGPPLYTGTPLPQDVCSALQWWGTPLNLLQGSPYTPPPSTSALHRRFYQGMGSSSDVPPDFRHVVPSAEVSAHQRSGTAGGSPRSSALPAPGHQQGRDSEYGQHHSRRSDQEPGRHTLTILVPPDCTPPRVGGPQTHHPGPAPLPGTSERGGQSIVPMTSDHQLGVDTVSTDTPPHVAPMGPASRRPLCHFRNRPPAHIRLSTPGPGSVED